MSSNIDQNEVNKFSNIAEKWWDPKGEFKPLHVINPLRAKYVASKINLHGKLVLDVGCGGGLLSEALDDYGATVMGIDVTEKNINVAKHHAEQSNKSIEYLHLDAKSLVQSKEEFFDVICCLEVVEHVPDPSKLIEDCSNLLKPGGLMFLSTINRNLRSFITAIIGAEYIFNILPKGTHEYEKFIHPSELASYMSKAQVRLIENKGMFYNPITHNAHFNNDLGVNYISYGKKES